MKKPLTTANFVHRFLIQSFQKHEAPTLFYQALHARIEVFVEHEGGSLDYEPDAYDADAWHWLVRTPNKRETVAYVRAWPNDTEPGCWHISKLMVMPKYHDLDYGRHLLTHVIHKLKQRHQVSEVRLLSTEKTRLFFEYLGFVPMGAAILHDGQPHIPLHLYVTTKRVPTTIK